MTEASTLGTMDTAPVLQWQKDGSSWALWKQTAAGRPEFGHPWRFCDHVDQSKWLSFTVTLRNPTFLALVQELTGNSPGQGGLISFPDSNWLLSIVIPHQPHLIDQPADVSVVWGYGLSVEQPGNFVRRPMAACSGSDIMTELLGHLHMNESATTIIEECTAFLA
jgi:oleate hydratase